MSSRDARTAARVEPGTPGTLVPDSSIARGVSVSRIKLPVLGEERAVECTECGRCCTYVGIGRNPPTRRRHATDVRWYLYHAGVYVYVDGGGEWSVHFEARCRNLGDD